ncbi:MAG: SDR family NAD(P)-dependent oxidoreductase [Puniceicoccaceae bacterium]
MKKKTALVTGGNRGIGKAIVAGLARMNEFNVLLGSRSLEKGRAAASQLEGDIVPVELDLADREILGRQMEAILGEYGTIDILVNNGAILREGNVLEVSPADFEESLRVNAIAAFDLIRHVVPGMEAAGFGRIVNVSSGWGSFREGLGGPLAYSVSKATLNAITMVAARDLPACIKINTMCPGWVRTEMGGMNADRSPEEGADTAIWLATLPDDGPTGGTFRDRQPIEW